MRWLLPLLYHRRFLPTWQWPPSCRSVKMVKWRHLGTPPCAGPLPDAQTSWAAGATMTVLLLHLHDNLQLHLHLHTTLSPLCLWHASVSCLDHLHMVQFGLRPSSSARALSSLCFPWPTSHHSPDSTLAGNLPCQHPWPKRVDLLLQPRSIGLMVLVLLENPC